ncbi:MAG: right-handed parallel beta-helix repeat-containing protein [Solirubrobacterales bacterium]
MRTQYGIALLVLTILTGSLYAATYYVDDNAPNDPRPYNIEESDPNEDGSEAHPFDSIQEAIDGAIDGDTIVVAPGRYLSADPWAYAELNFNGKSLRLVGSSPTDFDVADETILSGVVIFDGTETADCLLQGFKIQNHGHGGILGNGTAATVSHCIISGNGPCGATVVKDVRGPIRNCLIVDNTTFSDCGVLPVVSGFTELVNCTIANNLSNVTVPSSMSIVRNCIIWGNEDPKTTGPGMTRDGPSPEIAYNLVENWSWTRSNIIGDDPCFVRLGSWQEVTYNTRTRGSSSTQTEMVLVEGDYHLRTEGWRWVREETHGSHWYYDLVTSPAVDAGDPMDGLGEEPERALDDPEGQCGFNHAIDMGAYGGTAQASMAPTKGEAPGVGAVDLRDYWPLTETRNKWYVHALQGTARQIEMTNRLTGTWGEVYYLRTTNAPDWMTMIYSYYAGRTLYIAENAPVLNPSLPLQPPAHAQAQYPQYLIAGSTIEAPYDPFAKGGAEYRSVLVARGTLAEVLDGTGVDPALILTGSWPDVIALRETAEDGTAGEPIAIFARGFGPLMIAGQPITGAVINSKVFGTTTDDTGGGTRR